MSENQKDGDVKHPTDMLVDQILDKIIRKKHGEDWK